ncbi:DNA-directed RNA polymerase subunit omega [bacterium]|nr:DNA-directed RNA polymerase subunit omega [bacterium]
MARITVEDCLENETNRFALVRLASKRAKELLTGKPPVTETKGNKAIVSALREIADGKVRFNKTTEAEENPDATTNELANGHAH